jgi:hypothetical protein
MGKRNLEQEYQLILSEGLAKGEIRIRTGAPEQREAPRFEIQQGRIAVRVEPIFQLVDISATGIAFLSDLPFQTGQVLQLILKDTVAFQARVVCCPLVETDIDYMEMRYRVQCRFGDSANGKQLLVLIKEIERIGVSTIIN